MWKRVQNLIHNSVGCLKDEDGQAMIEFAVVLPILLLLTVGTLLLTVSFVQKARMNALAYMSARVGVVRRSDFQAVDQTLKLYQDRSKQNWVSELNLKSETVANQEVDIRLGKPGERLDLFANLISGNPPPDKPASLQVEIRQPVEYRSSGALRPKTISEVDYAYQSHSGLLNVLKLLPNSLLDDRQMADSMQTGENVQDEILGLQPPDKNLKWFYDHLGWQIVDTNREDAIGEFASLKKNYTYLREIQQGGSAMKFIFEKLLPFIDKVLGAVMVGMDAFEKAAVETATDVDKNVRSSFQNSASGQLSP